MNRSLTTLLASALCCSAYTALAANPVTAPNPPDSTDIGNSGSPQQTEQSDKPTSWPMQNMHMHKGSRMGSNDLKKMDTDNDGSVSKDEFLAYQGKRFDNMHKDSNGNIPVKGMMMKKHMSNNSNGHTSAGSADTDMPSADTGK